MVIDAKLRAFLNLIAWSEGTSTHPLTKNDGYDVIVTGEKAAGETGLEVFDYYADHPFAFGRSAKVVCTYPKIIRSTASGRYQLALKWWEAYKTMLRLADFSPESQDAVAIRQISEQGAIKKVENGEISDAIADCSNIWASFPGNNYQQNGGKDLNQLIEQYQQILNTLAS